MVKTARVMAQAIVCAAIVALCPASGMAEPFKEPAAAVPDPPSEQRALPHERIIALKHHWTREELKLVYRIGDDYQPEAMAAISRLMRDWRCDKTAAIDPKLIDLLYELHQELGAGGFIRVISAYRSEGYNASLLRAGRTVDPDSQHTLGRAVDVIFPGVKADRLRAAAAAKGLGGVGYYPFSGPVFVHVDTGPARDWVETDPRLRRALAPGARRQRFVLDCALTMDKVFEDIPEELAYAALPPGAAVKPHPEAEELRGAVANASSFPPASLPPAVAPPALHEAARLSWEVDGPACWDSAPPARQSQMPQPVSLPRVGEAPGVKGRAAAREKPRRAASAAKPLTRANAKRASKVVKRPPTPAATRPAAARRTAAAAAATRKR